MPVPTSRNMDVVAGAVVATGGAILFLAAQRIERLPGDTEVIGPAAFPTVLSLVLVLAGLALLVSGLRSKPDDGITAEIMQIDDSHDVNELLDPEEPSVPLQRLLLVVATFAAYCLILIPLGFLLATTAYLMVTTCLVDAAKWKRNLLFSVAFSAMVYVSFTQLLGVELPAGLFG